MIRPLCLTDDHSAACDCAPDPDPDPEASPPVGAAAVAAPGSLVAPEHRAYTRPARRSHSARYRSTLGSGDRCPKGRTSGALAGTSNEGSPLANAGPASARSASDGSSVSSVSGPSTTAAPIAPGSTRVPYEKRRGEEKREWKYREIQSVERENTLHIEGTVYGCICRCTVAVPY